MTTTVPRALSPATNPAGLTAGAGAIFAAAVMIYNAVNHHGVIDPAVLVAAVGAVLALLTRQYVTPVADPKNGAGVPLVPVVPTIPTIPPPVPSPTVAVPQLPPAP